MGFHARFSLSYFLYMVYFKVVSGAYLGQLDI